MLTRNNQNEPAGKQQNSLTDSGKGLGMKFVIALLSGIVALGAFAAEDTPFKCHNAVFENGIYTIENTTARKAYVTRVYEWNQTEVKPFTFGCEYLMQAPKDAKGVASIRVNLKFTDGTSLAWINVGFSNNTKFTLANRKFRPKKPVRTATVYAEFSRPGKIQIKNIFVKEDVATTAPAKH